MNQHVTYHPLDTQLARLFACFTLDERGPHLAAEYCKRQGLDQPHTDRLLGLLPHYALRDDAAFDQTHGFHTAVLQGFFDTYYFIDATPLSALGDLIAPYLHNWQTVVPDNPHAATAVNRLSGTHSSGVFIGPDKIAQFMADVHAVPALTDAIAVAFPGNAAHTLWAALQHALDHGVGLLEAAGVLVSNRSDLLASDCYTKFSNCDAASLQAFIADERPGSQLPAPAAPPVAPAAPNQAPTAAQGPAATAARPAGAPRLGERLRARRSAPAAVPAIDADGGSPDLPAPPAAPAPQATTDLPPPPAAPQATADLPPPPAAPQATTDLPPPPATPAPPEAQATASEAAEPAAAAVAVLHAVPIEPALHAPEDSDELEAEPALHAPEDSDDSIQPVTDELEDADVAEPEPALHAPEDSDELEAEPALHAPEDSDELEAEPALHAPEDSDDSIQPVTDELEGADVAEPEPATSPDPHGPPNLVAVPDVARESVLRVISSLSASVAGAGISLAVAPEPDHELVLENEPLLKVVPDLDPEPDHDAELPDTAEVAEIIASVEPLQDTAAKADEVVDTRLRLCAGGHAAGGAVYFETWEELWATVGPLANEEPIFLEVTDMASRWEPFSLIGTATGTAIVRYRNTANGPALRVFGVHVDDLDQIEASSRTALIVDWTETESADTTGSFAIPRTHLLAPHMAKASGQSLMGNAHWQPLFNDIAAR